MLSACSLGHLEYYFFNENPAKRRIAEKQHEAKTWAWSSKNDLDRGNS
jgi:hypothetical protein